MDEPIRLLRELRSNATVTDVMIARLFEVCEQHKVPSVTIYTHAEYEGWYEMSCAYVFTSRTDAHMHMWLFSTLHGLEVFDQDGKNGVPFEQWDPEAELFTDESLYEGGTNMNPIERERGRRQG